MSKIIAFVNFAGFVLSVVLSVYMRDFTQTVFAITKINLLKEILNLCFTDNLATHVICDKHTKHMDLHFHSEGPVSC